MGWREISKDYENLKISIGVSNGYNDYIYNCFIAEIGELLSGESWISTNMAMNWTTSFYDEDAAIFAKSWFVNYISEKGEESDKTKDLPSTYYAYQRRLGGENRRGYMDELLAQHNSFQNHGRIQI